MQLTNRPAMQVLMLAVVLAQSSTAVAQAPRPKPRPQPRAPAQPQRRPAQKLSFAQLKARYLATAGQAINLRIPALSALFQVKTAECVRFLDEIRRTEPNVSLRLQAIRGIGSVGVPPAQTILEQVFRDGAANERSAALSGLSSIRPPVPVDVFLAAMGPKQELSIRTAAARALRSYPTVTVANALLGVLSAPDSKDTSGMLRRAVVDSFRMIIKKPPVDEWFATTALATDASHVDLLPDLLRLAPASGHPEIRSAVIEYLTHSEPLVRAAAADAIGEIDEGRGADAGDALEELAKLLKDRDENVIIAAGVAVGRIGPAGDALEAIIRLARSRNPGLRAIGIGALGGSKDAQALGLAKKGLGDRSFAVRAASVEALSRMGTKEAVTALIAGLKKNKDGRLHVEIIRALQRLTGADAGAEFADWNKWWGVVKDNFEMPGADEQRRPSGNATVSRGPSYYGSEVVSKRVVFIVDISGSMSAQMKAESGAARQTRLQVCQQELRKVIGGLDRKTFFNIIAFETRFRPWAKRITKATADAKQSALAFVNALKPTGGTNIFDPLESGLLDPDVDTIYLLSDGSPGSGKFVQAADILREVKKINIVRRIAIHTISVGVANQLMKDLAEQNSGDAIVR